jgi:cellulose synthase/poly-beta-1,6-N-acetylglucosamine synthase-like glycosyltransferase
VRPTRFQVLWGLTIALLALVLAAAFLGRGPWAWAAGFLYLGYESWLTLSTLLASRRALVTTPQARGAPGPPPRMAVLIAARNECAVLPSTLMALAGQHDRPERIVVIDDGSTDGSLAMLAAHHGLVFRDDVGTSMLRPDLLVLCRPGGGKARALNAALALVDEEVVVTLDADTVLEPGAIAALRAAFTDDPELVVASGVLTPVCAPSWSGKVFQFYQTFEYLRSFLSRLAWAHQRTLVLVSGAFAAFRRAPLVASGGFDPTSKAEDYEVMFRLHRTAGPSGLPVAMVSDARATTDAPGTFRQFMRQRRRWFAGFIATLVQNQDMVGDPRYGRLGTFHLPLKTLDTLLPLYGLFALIALAIFLIAGGTLHPAILIALAAKFAFDLCCQAWGIGLYVRWLDQPFTLRFYAASVCATLTEPLCFQLLRQIGAALGWVAYLRGAIDWAPQRLATTPGPPP